MEILPIFLFYNYLSTAIEVYAFNYKSRKTKRSNSSIYLSDIDLNI